MFVVDITKENIAIREANRLNIPVFAMVDTNSDPYLVDFPIPANDDAAKSISLILEKVSEAILEGLEERKQALAKIIEKRKKEGVPKEDDEEKITKKHSARKSGSKKKTEPVEDTVELTAEEDVEDKVEEESVEDLEEDLKHDNETDEV